MLWSMAWRNIVRHKRRSGLTALAMGIGVALCMVILAITEGMYGQMRDVMVTGNIGHVVLSHPEYAGRRAMHDTLPEALLGELAAVPGLSGAMPRLIGSALLGGETRTTGAQLVGLDPGVEAAVRKLDTKVVEGRWLGAEPQGDIVIGKDLARKLGVKLGDALVAVTQAADGSMGNELYTVVGLVSTGSSATDGAGGFLHLADVQRLLSLQGKVHEIAVIGGSDAQDQVQTLADGLLAVVGDRAQVRTWWEVDPTVGQLFEFQGITSAIMIGLFQGIAALGVINTLLMSVSERTRELGVLRAIGMRPREVVGMVVTESVVLALIGAAGGLLVGGLLDGWLATAGLDLSVKGGDGFKTGQMTFDPIIRARVTVENVLQPVIGVLMFAVLSSVWPAWRAVGIDPITAIRQE